MDFSPYFDRLETDPPAIWSLSWVADYPGPNDFLGLLLGSGRTNNYGRWSSPEFDAAISDGTLGTRRGDRTRGIRPGRGHRPRRGTGHPARVWIRLGARQDRAARRGPERARHHPDGGVGMGRLTDRLRAATLAAAVGGSHHARPCSRDRPRGEHRLRDADGNAALRSGHRLQRHPRHRRRRSTGSSCSCGSRTRRGRSSSRSPLPAGRVG